MTFKFILFICLLVSSCIKNIDEISEKKGIPKTVVKQGLKDITIDKDFDFSVTRNIKINIQTNELIKLDIYEIQQLRNEKKLLASYTVSSNFSINRNVEKGNSLIFLVITSQDKTDYRQKLINGGVVNFDLRY